MAHWRTVLFCDKGVWGDGIRRMLRREEDFDLVATMPLDEASLAQAAEVHPDVIFVAGDESRTDVRAFIANLLEVIPDVPLVLLSLSEPSVRLVRARPLPARWEALLQSLSEDLGRDRHAA